MGSVRVRVVLPRGKASKPGVLPRGVPEIGLISGLRIVASPSPDFPEGKSEGVGSANLAVPMAEHRAGERHMKECLGKGGKAWVGDPHGDPHGDPQQARPGRPDSRRGDQQRKCHSLTSSLEERA